MLLHIMEKNKKLTIPLVKILISNLNIQSFNFQKFLVEYESEVLILIKYSKLICIKFAVIKFLLKQ